MPGSLQTANLNGEYKVIGDTGDAGFYFDPSSFSQPQGVTFGNTGRNQFRGPGFWNIDFSIFRAFPIGPAASALEFRAEFFNLTNTPDVGPAGGDISSGNFGRVTTVGNDGARQRKRARLGHRRAADPLRRAVPVLKRTGSGLRTTTTESAGAMAIARRFLYAWGQTL